MSELHDLQKLYLHGIERQKLH